MSPQKHNEKFKESSIPFDSEYHFELFEQLSFLNSLHNSGIPYIFAVNDTTGNRFYYSGKLPFRSFVRCLWFFQSFKRNSMKTQ